MKMYLLNLLVAVGVVVVSLGLWFAAIEALKILAEVFIPGIH